MEPLRTSGLIRTVIFDVDDVLLEMRRSLELAEKSTQAPLSQVIGGDAVKVQQRFSEIYRTMIQQLRRPPGDVDPIAAELRRRINAWQRGLVTNGHEVKPWSRETMLAMALEDHGHKPSSVLIRAAIDRYWDTVSREATLFEDARQIIEELKKRGIPFQLATNSDGFMDLHQEWQTFFYDPIDAAARKIGRMREIAKLGIGPKQITVGDPIGKPAPAFYQRTLSELTAQIGSAVDLSTTLVAGDSLTHDVLPFIQLGAAQGLFLVREQDARNAPAPASLPPNVQVVASLTEILRFL